MKKEFYTVKETAALLNLSEHTIRFYCDKGLVPSLQRDSNNVRLFSRESINWLIGIKRLKECGMSIEALKKYVDLCLEGDSSVPKRYEIIQEYQKYAEVQLQEAIERVEYLNHKLAHYQKILDLEISDDTNPAKW